MLTVQVADEALDEAVRSYAAALSASFPRILWELPSSAELRQRVGFAVRSAWDTRETQTMHFAATSPAAVVGEALLEVQAAFVGAFRDIDVPLRDSVEPNPGGCRRCGTVVVPRQPETDGLCMDCFALQPQNRDVRGVTVYRVSSTGTIHTPSCPSAAKSPERRATFRALLAEGGHLCKRCHPHVLHEKAIGRWQPAALAWCEEERQRCLTSIRDTGLASRPRESPGASLRESKLAWGWVIALSAAGVVTGIALWPAVLSKPIPSIATGLPNWSVLLVMLLAVAGLALTIRDERRYRMTGSGKAARSYEVEPPDRVDRSWHVVATIGQLAFLALVIVGLIESCSR